MVFEKIIKKKIDYNNLTLMCKDIPVANIEMVKGTPIVKQIYEKELFPTLINESDKEKIENNLNQWMRTRCIPGARTNIITTLSKLNMRSTIELSCKAMGISLNDQYWYKPKNLSISWDKINPYKNGFSNDLGDIMFDPMLNTVSVDLVSPDATTNGVDPKRWILDNNNQAYLMKTNSHSEQVACNEMLASEMCRRLGIRSVVYNKIRKDIMLPDAQGDFYKRNCLFAVSKNFCDENHRFVSAHTYKCNCLGVGEKEFVRDVLMYSQFKEDIGKMIVLDFLISNEDRHYHNFGFLFDENGNVELAPIFDSGNSMFYNEEQRLIGGHETYSSIAPTYKEALELAFTRPSDFDWYDSFVLEGIDEYFKNIMKDTDISKEKQEMLCKYLNSRIKELDQYIQNFKENYCDIDEVLSGLTEIDDNNASGYKINNGRVVLTSENAKNECRHLLETKQIASVNQYPAYLNAKNNER